GGGARGGAVDRGRGAGRGSPRRNILPPTEQITGDHRVQEINGQPPAQEKKGHREHYRQYIVLLVTSPGNHLRPEDTATWQRSRSTPSPTPPRRPGPRSSRWTTPSVSSPISTPTLRNRRPCSTAPSRSTPGPTRARARPSIGSRSGTR